MWANSRDTEGIQKFYDKRLYHDLHNLKLANGEPPDSALSVKRERHWKHSWMNPG